jgi:trehalose 6-phosphate synthase
LARIFIISNRVSVPDTSRGARAGGLEVALRATLRRHSCVWLGWSGDVKDKDDCRTRTVQRGDMTYIVTDLSEDDYQEYYSGFANQVLWPILHYRLDLAEFSRRDLSGYLRVNDRFAVEIDKVLEPDDIIWVHDYHLIPLAKALRERGRNNKIGFFLHIPMPPPDILTALPHHDRLIQSLCHYDLVGFQTENDAANFARYLATECGMPAHIPRGGGPGSIGAMRIGAFPVGIETREFAAMAMRAMQSNLIRRVRESVPGEIVIGVDRLDYSKGIIHRLEAYECFLRANPGWRGRVTYMQITPKSRSEIEEYAEIQRQVDSAAGHINSTFGDVAWTPVRYINKTYSRGALAGLYRAGRVGLVTPLRDGMNLVAKEYVAAQNPMDPGVLILSRFAGAAAEFASGALLVNPYDPETVAQAIARALDMPLHERIARYRKLFDALLSNDLEDWGDRFLAVLTGDHEAFGPHPRDGGSDRDTLADEDTRSGLTAMPGKATAPLASRPPEDGR